MSKTNATEKNITDRLQKAKSCFVYLKKTCRYRIREKTKIKTV